MTSTAGPTEHHQGAPSPSAAYIHVPFCAHRCGYCDFTLIAGRDDLVGDYLDALDLEMDRTNIPEGAKLDTLFLGGGTPTHPTPAQLHELFRILRCRFQISNSTEVSVEANPLDLSDEKIECLLDAGVNRISLGVQSFSRETLKLLERDHLPEDISGAVDRLKKNGFSNISLDLIFGVPGQTVGQWKETLKRATDLSPQHISSYGLTFESGTVFWTRRERGDLIPIDEELEREQYAVAMEELANAGFEQYEISNFAKPGYQCRHNKCYWSGDAYWGFGPGAASYVNGRRQTNIRSVLGWLGRIERHDSPVAEFEELNREHRARELAYLGLRRNAGINRLAFRNRTGLDFDNLFSEAVERLIGFGLLKDDGLHVALTRAGRFIADRVVMEFL